MPDEPEEKTLGEGEPCPAFQCILLLLGSPSCKRRPFQAVFPGHPGPPLMKLKCLHLGGSVVPPAPAPSPGPGPRGHTPHPGRAPPRRSSRRGSPCRWRRCGRGWASTRPPGPRSSCRHSPPGSGSGAWCRRPRRGPRSGTGCSRPRLWARGSGAREARAPPRGPGPAAHRAGGGRSPCCHAATSQDTLGTSQ